MNEILSALRCGETRSMWPSCDHDKTFFKPYLDLKKVLAMFDSGVDGGVGGTAFSVGWFKDLPSRDDFSWSVVCGEMENLSGNIEKSAR